ncbi:MAG: 3,5-cyclic-AMP phosphodiesterase [Solirubrobacteraceae bacterium]|nr:3,5-cyclic-AMP phosphodiesterase [Solirubrobacteraceae bacterium]
MLPPGEHTIEIADRVVGVIGDGGPAAHTIDGLPAATALDIVVDGHRAATMRTLRPPAGRELCRFATVGDIHIGDGWTFGILPTVRDPGGAEDPPAPRALSAAVRELTAWGAQQLVVKGDVTHHGRAGEWHTAAEILTGTGLPVVATVGNHDVCAGAVDGRPAMHAAGAELAVEGIVVRDLPGVRLLVADVSRPRRHTGSYRHVRGAVLEAATAAEGAVVLAQHHQLMRLPVPNHWPPGVMAPESARFLRALAEANPATLLTTGHTHRYRARRVGPLLLTEVGSTKDHPGAWAGYVVHEGGIRQVVRRIEEPGVLRWTEATRQALFGIWGRWSPGRLGDRCRTHDWPARAG